MENMYIINRTVLFQMRLFASSLFYNFSLYFIPFYLILFHFIGYEHWDLRPHAEIFSNETIRKSPDAAVD